MGFAIPNAAKTVLLLEEKLKTYYSKLCHSLQVYNRVTASVR